jgi:hypothetical protein
MDSRTFIKVMRKLISEEVHKAVKAEMHVLLKEQKKDHGKTMNQGMQMAYESNAPMNLVELKDRRTFVKDSMLNSILNETAAGMVPGELYEGVATVSQDTISFNSNSAQGFGMLRAGQQSGKALITDIHGTPADVSNEKVAAVADAMTRDYSKLMKAIDKKKGIK